MTDLSKEIWKDLLQVEKEAAPRTSKPKVAKDAPPQADHWSHPVLLERGAYLRKLAKLGDGQASETLKEYPQHATMLSFRARNGVAELHENFADLFCVLEGRATLVTGGTVVNPEQVGPGEIRGASIDGGQTYEMRPGDIINIPAKTPHQVIVPAGGWILYMVVKINTV